ncbi:MAG: HEAT repeat domain-containing protein [Acidobacteriota bacterium]|nr:HEAT repeat domain-containing protein [Acidobacteriota bacterium]
MAQSELQRFQASADTDSLLRHVRRLGKDPQKYQAAADALAPVFNALAAGKKPSYEGLRPDALREREQEVSDILRWMAGSENVETRIAAIELMGLVGAQSFTDDLTRFLSSGDKRERLAAIGSLGEIASERSMGALKTVAQDPDPEIRTAVGAAFFNLSSKL